MTLLADPIPAPPSRWAREFHFATNARPLPRRWVPHTRPPVRHADRSPFHVTAALRRLCADIAARCDTFAHLDLSAAMFTFTPSRSAERHGLLARVTPLRFRDGQLYRRRRGRLYQVQRYFADGREQMYFVTLCLPRFLDQPFEQKLTTIFHELYHIGPKFDGDIRRHEGRYAVHTHSKKEYDERMGELARRYLADHPEPRVFGFLHATFAELWDHFGGVYGVTLPQPKMVPVRDDPEGFA